MIRLLVYGSLVSEEGEGGGMQVVIRLLLYGSLVNEFGEGGGGGCRLNGRLEAE